MENLNIMSISRIENISDKALEKLLSDIDLIHVSKESQAAHESINRFMELRQGLVIETQKANPNLAHALNFRTQEYSKNIIELANRVGADNAIL